MDQVAFNLIVGTILRSAIMLAAGWLVAHGMLPQGSMEDWAAAAALMVLGLAWGIYQKYVAQRLFHTALESPPGTTPDEVKAKVALGLGASAIAKAVIPFVVATTLAMTACAPPPTIQTEPGKRAWQANQVLQRVEELQETAIQAEASGALPTATAKVIVQFTVTAAKTCQAYQQGWEKALAAAYTSAKAQIPASVLTKSEVAFALGMIEGIIRSLNGGVL